MRVGKLPRSRGRAIAATGEGTRARAIPAPPTIGALVPADLNKKAASAVVGMAGDTNPHGHPDVVPPRTLHLLLAGETAIMITITLNIIIIATWARAERRLYPFFNALKTLPIHLAGETAIMIVLLINGIIIATWARAERDSTHF